ncbi:hypothetical protein N7492_006192 [Penicillium capsulatum]|uniref:DNA-directed RNA polymerase n=1 Tax=Penicillium capsulatum TaxID=69766 RepID=A0A9W9LMA9_9EURO|nr:hypothetical protein N7492_006192 [Penicillium capsulatum]
MLSRVARQKNAHFRLRKAPAYRALGVSSSLRLHSSLNRPGSSTGPTDSPKNERPRRPSFQSQRNLATAADPAALEQDSNPLLFEDSWQSAMESSLFGSINSTDASSLMILDDTPQTKPIYIRKVRGIGGDQDELMANFDMSLKVGKIHRAAALVKRLGSFYPPDSPEYLSFHNRYLLAVVSQAIITRQQDMVFPIQKWFEVDIPAAGVQPDATTLAGMIRLSLRMLHGSKRDRCVRRYWELAKNANLHEDVLAVEVLTDLDLGELSRICYSDLRHFGLDAIPSDGDMDGLMQEESDTMSEVLPTTQKGLGLSSLKESLSIFSDNFKITLPEGFQGTEQQRERMYSQMRQQRLEADTLGAAINRWRIESAETAKFGMPLASGKSMKEMISQWHLDLSSRIREEVKLSDEDESKPMITETQKERFDYGVYLRYLDPERVAALTILAVMHSFTRVGMDNGVKLSVLTTRIGREFQDEVIAQDVLRKQVNQSPRRMKVMEQLLANRNGKDRARWQGIFKNMQEDNFSKSWSSMVSLRIGACLMTLLMEVAKTSIWNKEQSCHVTHSVFQHAYTMTFGKRIGLIHMHPEVVKKASREPSTNIIDRHLPMVSKPRPWTGMRDGGYMLYKTDLVRTTPGERLQPAYIKAALERDGLDAIRSGLDVLGGTGWVINSDVLEVMIEAWNSGKPIGKLAPLEPELAAPPKPDVTAGIAAEKAWERSMGEMENLRSGYHSQRCFQNFQLEVARAFRKDTFYLPHNLDFRGRAYPLPPYLNQMAADHARALLLFSERKPLGASGLRWLKIQVANLAGFDKASMSEREKFADDHVDDILDSANNGIHGKAWWLQAEDPWQCLAACCELRNALGYADPTEYPSNLPIHQDGSCNGLQHYAALGGDTIGAQQVNLEPSDRPSDVYTGVSEFVKAKVAEEASAGLEIAQLLNGKISRKIVKQTVMTNVYGVTFMGAMKQVRKQLTDHYPDMTLETRSASALYIARKIFDALGSMFTGAHEIQYWLGDCASRITQSLSPEDIEQCAKEALQASSDSPAQRFDPAQKFRSTVIWTTPLGLPVVQPYRSRKTRRIATSMQSINVIDPLSTPSLPPNFIHSLDATHMMLSANACHKAGLTFSAVHDSFWTHAGDVDSMNRILRDAFVLMHSDDVIRRLAAEFNARYGRHLFLAKIPRHNKIARAVDAFRRASKQKRSKLQELLDEHKRQQLLRSDDPALQAEGRAMETAASIFEKMGGTDADMNISNTLGETGVGHVPNDPAGRERRCESAVDTTDPALETLFGDIERMESKFSKDNTEGKARMADVLEDGEAAPSAPKNRSTKCTSLWLPLRLRDIPAKGAWDVTRIRDSKYFFS